MTVAFLATIVAHVAFLLPTWHLKSSYSHLFDNGTNDFSAVFVMLTVPL
jgi:hypothetical protein